MLAALQKVFAGPLLGCLPGGSQARFSSKDMFSVSAVCVCYAVTHVFPALLCQAEEVEISDEHQARTGGSHGKLPEKCSTQY